MTVKVFVSVPMNKRSVKEIEEDLLRATNNLSKLYPNSEIRILDSNFPYGPTEFVSNLGIWYLGESLKVLANADVAYFVKGWRHARGCRVEHECCSQYGIACLYERSED